MTDEELAKLLIDATAAVHMAATSAFGSARAGEVEDALRALDSLRRTADALGKIAPIVAERVRVERGVR